MAWLRHHAHALWGGEDKNMTTVIGASAALPVVAHDLTLRDLRDALAAGWADFRAFPAFGLFFASFFVFSGLFLYFALFTWQQVAWLVPLAGGFPLVAPFIAVGLYEVSRRREAGLPMTWRAVLRALRGRGDDQLLMMGGFVFVGFTFWIIIAHSIFAIAVSASGLGSESLALFGTQAGIAMLIVGGGIGAILALVFFSVTVISLPMLVDRDVDFLTAIIASLATVKGNFAVMLGWGAVIAVLLFVAMIPLFLGLFVILPLLAHATWHLYRRVLGRVAG